MDSEKKEGDAGQIEIPGCGEQDLLREQVEGANGKYPRQRQGHNNSPPSPYRPLAGGEWGRRKDAIPGGPVTPAAKGEGKEHASDEIDEEPIAQVIV